MELLQWVWTYVLPFLVVLSALIFVHEWGHYRVALACGVRVEVFSFGFGPELFGWNDRRGTRWKVAAVPLGGYVKMFGDADAASTPGQALQEMSPEEQAVSFHHKPLRQRFAIVAAGPLANFGLAVVVMGFLFSTFGQPFTPADVGSVTPGSAAEAAGIRPGDVVRTIDGQTIRRFEELQAIVYVSPGRPLEIVLDRGGVPVTVTATPRMSPVKSAFGGTSNVGLLGIRRGGVEYRRLDPLSAVVESMREVWVVSAGTLQGMGQMITGSRGAEDLGGPLRIAQMSGEVAKNGIASLLMFIAVLSINLGLINLFPIPLLDGGHLLFYAAEAGLGRPLDERTQEFGFRIGLALVLTLMVFATWNDLVHLRVVEFFKGLIS